MKKSFGNKIEAEAYATTHAGKLNTWEHPLMGTMYEVEYDQVDELKMVRLRIAQSRLEYSAACISALEDELNKLRNQLTTRETEEMIEQDLKWWKESHERDKESLLKIKGD